MDSKRVGVLGGGQLGRMLMEPAHRLNVEVVFLDQPDSPAKLVSSSTAHVNGDFKDPQKIRELAEKVDVLTFEIEHVDTEVLDALSSTKQVHPSPATIRTIQDKYLQKRHLEQHGLPLPEYRDVRSVQDVLDAAADNGGKFGYPMMLKSKRLAYDGRGNYVVRTAADAEAGWKALNPSGTSELYVEKWVPFVRELAVMVVRAADGQVVSYPVVETVHRRSICHVVIAPAQIDGVVAQKARDVASRCVASFSGAGIFGVEMFLLANGGILVNEIAPRPHNSGHYTIEASETSQFENHLRAVVGLPLGSTAMKVPYSAMVNIIGTGSDAAAFEETLRPCKAALATPGATVHLYGKKECKRDRKMGHVTIVADTFVELKQRTERILGAMTDQSGAPQLEPSPLVGVIMGSDSDLPTMKPCAQLLEEFGVPFELTIVSAHRTPQRMMDYARSAHERGIKVIIAAAGGAAHLPGMVAAITPLPVIGVPVALKVLDGVDSLHSIVQMPRGVPVATVAINNSTNAALLAVRMLGSHSTHYLQAMIKYQESMEQEVLRKVDKLSESGWDKY
ncbi:phosphoribosylaminoimidazole carboxylase ade2 [Sorochytrium milnesiophthora]